LNAYVRVGHEYTHRRHHNQWSLATTRRLLRRSSLTVYEKTTACGPGAGHKLHCSTISHLRADTRLRGSAPSARGRSAGASRAVSNLLRWCMASLHSSRSGLMGRTRQHDFHLGVTAAYTIQRVALGLPNLDGHAPSPPSSTNSRRGSHTELPGDSW